MTLADYLPIFILLVLATAFAGGSVFVASKTGPRRPSPEKNAPYECGIEPDHALVERFPVKFYGIAMLFIIFDIEMILLLPYAVLTRELGLFGLAEMGVFLTLLFGAYLYVRRSGGLDWEEEETSLRRALSAQLVQRYRRDDLSEGLGA